jgi:hypothetical protein
MIGVSAELIADLRRKIRFDSDADIARFLGDAVRVYAELGGLAARGGTLIWRAADGAERRILLPSMRAEPDDGDIS